MKKLTLISLLFLLLSCTSTDAELQALTKLIESYESFEAYDEEAFPLGDYSEERFERSVEFWTQLREQLAKIDTTAFERTDQISYALLDFELHHLLEDFKFKTHWNPILSDAGFHNNLVYRVKAISTVKEAEDYLALLEAIPLYVSQHIALLRKGLAAGNAQPLVIFDGYASTYEQHIDTPVEDHFYYQPFNALPASIEQEKESVYSYKRGLWCRKR